MRPPLRFISFFKLFGTFLTNFFGITISPLCKTAGPVLETLPPFLNGNNVMRKFKLQPGPLIGKVLSGLEEAQAIGKVKNKKGAYDLAASIIKRKK